MARNKNLTDFFDEKWGFTANTAATGSNFVPAKTTYYKPADKYAPTARCHESHPGLKIGDHVIYGGSCSYPVIRNADDYIGFDYSMRPMEHVRPWKDQNNVYHPVTDMSVPDNVEAYKALVSWTADRVRAGKKVHCGCIGGHGRTGMFLAALVKEMTGESDAITYVRQHYCHKAVETSGQIDWLHTHFGIKKTTGSKGHHHAGKSNTLLYDDGEPIKAKGKAKGKASAKSKVEIFEPIKGRGCIWGD